jgi:porphobilinogen synthase
MVQENHLRVTDFIMPVFVVEGTGIQEEISSMPGYFRYSLDLLLPHIEEAFGYGIRSVLVFVKVSDALKDNEGKEALNPEGLMPRTISAIKKACPEMFVMSDVALDPYSSFGHDGIVSEGEILNEETVEVLAEMSVVHAEAGVDMVAPSDMMDGRIEEIRDALDDAEFDNVGIMSYTVKYASCFYGPFRDALDSAPGFGDKKTYQMNPANAEVGLRELKLDLEEGADIVMVKPGMPYLDMVYRIKEQSNVPVSVYQVSGEYSMIKAASEKGWLNYEDTVLESLIAFKRAGADLIATYFAFEMAKKMSEK